MSKLSPLFVVLACLLGVIALTFSTNVIATVPPLNEQQPMIDTWRSSLSKLRREHAYYFPDNVSDDILGEFDKFLVRMRGMGLEADSVHGWNAIKGLRSNSPFDDNNATTRADRHSPFKVPNQADQDYQENLKQPLFGLASNSPNVVIDSSVPYNFFSSDDGATESPLVGENDDYADEFAHFSTLQSTNPNPGTPTIPQHLIPSVQGLESNRGSGALAVPTTAYCRTVLRDDYMVYPQKVLIDLELGSIAFQDLECERHIERDDIVKLLPIVSSLLSDDVLRYQFAKLGCSWFYRPLSNPTKRPCASQCVTVRNFIRDLDLTTASPSQRKDRAVLQTIAWPLLLLSGQCEFANLYDTSNDPEKCISGDDYQKTFKTFDQAKLARPTCQPYPQTGALCSGMLTNSYNDPTNKSITALIQSSTPLLKSLFAIAPWKGQSQCAQALARQMCSRYVMSCTEVPVTMQDSEGVPYAVKYALPVLPHRSVCTRYESSCRSFLTQLTATLSSSASPSLERALALLNPDCNTKAPVGATYECNGQNFSSTYDLFPTSTFYTMPLGVSQAAIRTNNFTYATQYDQSQVIPFTPEITCPPPLVKPDSPDASKDSMLGTSSCAQPCPSMQFTKSDYNSASTVALIITTLSLICAIFLVVSYAFFKEIRQGNYFLQFLSCLILICCSFAIGIYSRYHPGHSVQETFCVNNTTIASQNQNAGCAVEGFIILFAISAISAFFASSGFDLFLRVVLQVEVRPHTQQDYLLNLGYFFWGWTIPLLLTTIAAGTKSLGPGDLGVFYCFVNGRHNPTVPWAVAYLPFMVQLFIGCVSLSTTIYQLVRVAKRQQEEEFERQAREHNYRSQTAPQIRLGNYFVPLMLELVFFLYLGWIVLFRAVVYFLEPEWRKNGAAFAQCLLITKPIQDYFALLQGSAQRLDCGSRPDTITLPTWWIHQVFLASLGMITFLVLGTQRIYYQLWAAVIGYYFNIPSLLVWAATTQQAKIYGKRLARQRRERTKKLRDAGRNDELREQADGKEIVEQIKEQDKLVKEKMRQEQEDKAKKDRERAIQIQQQNLAMIAPHLRPLYMVQQRPRRQLESLVDLVQKSEGQIGPYLAPVPDIFVYFNIQGDGKYQDFADQYD